MRAERPGWGEWQRLGQLGFVDQDEQGGQGAHEGLTQGDMLELCVNKVLLLTREGNITRGREEQEDRLKGSCGHHEAKNMLTWYPECFSLFSAPSSLC